MKIPSFDNADVKITKIGKEVIKDGEQYNNDNRKR